FIGGALLDVFRFSIAPNARREDGLVTFIDVVADGLADEVRGDGPGLQAMLREDFVTLVAIRLVPPFDDVEVIAPAREFKAVVTERLGLLRDRVEGEVGPLAGEQCDGACHKSNDRVDCYCLLALDLMAGGWGCQGYGAPASGPARSPADSERT